MLIRKFLPAILLTTKSSRCPCGVPKPVDWNDRRFILDSQILLTSVIQKSCFFILQSFLPPTFIQHTSLRKPLDISHTKPGRWVRRYQGQWSGWRWLHPLFLLWWKIPRFFFSGSIVILYILLHVYTYKKYLAKKSKIHIEVWCGFVDDIDRLQVVCFLDWPWNRGVLYFFGKPFKTNWTCHTNSCKFGTLQEILLLRETCKQRTWQLPEPIAM